MGGRPHSLSGDQSGGARAALADVGVASNAAPCETRRHSPGRGSRGAAGADGRGRGDAADADSGVRGAVASDARVGSSISATSRRSVATSCVSIIFISAREDTRAPPAPSRRRCSNWCTPPSRYINDERAPKTPSAPSAYLSDWCSARSLPLSGGAAAWDAPSPRRDRRVPPRHGPRLRAPAPYPSAAWWKFSRVLGHVNVAHPADDPVPARARAALSCLACRGRIRWRAAVKIRDGRRIRSDIATRNIRTDAGVINEQEPRRLRFWQFSSRKRNAGSSPSSSSSCCSAS